MHKAMGQWFAQGLRIRFSTSIMFLLLISFMITNIIQALDQSRMQNYYCSTRGVPVISNNGSTNNGSNAIYSTGSAYEKNLNTLLSSFSSNNGSNANYSGFYSSSYGEKPNQVYAIGLCRGDLNPGACRICLSDSTRVLKQECPHDKEALLLYDNCTLRYSDSAIEGVVKVAPSAYQYTQNVSSPSYAEWFDQDFPALLKRVRSEAAAGGDARKYATGNSRDPNSSRTIYGLVQCSPDLSEKDCSGCFDEGFERTPPCCFESGRYDSPFCNFRYEPYLFYGNATEISVIPMPSPPLTLVYPPPPSGTTTSGGKESNTSRNVIRIVVAIIVSVVLIISFFIYLASRKKKQTVVEDEIRTAEAFQFNFGTIEAATSNFSDENKLGRGGFGVVYRGKLPNGESVAVKRLSMDSAQGDLEFKNEISLVARLQHRNLVSLLGFCLEGNERLLVYDFVPNGSLDQHIYDPIKRTLLDWDSRNKIILDIGRGLLYLHEDSRLRIIHRDLKAGNILLDAKMNAKIADFGMARLFAFDQTRGETIRICGTYGYMAPEYVLRGQYSVKSDVYSFGVLILEIVSGQKSTSFLHEESEEDLLSHAWKTWRDRTISNFMDPTLRTAASTTEVMRCIHIGLLCVQPNIADRPNMTSVILMLTSNSLTLPAPSEPTFFPIRSDIPTVKRSNISSSINEASITELYPRL